MAIRKRPHQSRVIISIALVTEALTYLLSHIGNPCKRFYPYLQSQKNMLTFIVEKNQAAVFSISSSLYLFEISRQFEQIQPPLVKTTIVFKFSVNEIGTDAVGHPAPRATHPGWGV